MTVGSPTIVLAWRTYHVGRDTWISDASAPPMALVLLQLPHTARVVQYYPPNDGPELLSPSCISSVYASVCTYKCTCW